MTSFRPVPERAKIDKFTEVAIQAAKVGMAILQESARSGFQIEHKHTIDLVTDADRWSEQAIVEVIHQAYPAHQILAEEEGLHASGDSPYKWVIDPLDGTTNFAHGFPAYCVSIALEYQGQWLLGVVMDPTRDELFVAKAGGGASLNGEPIHVSKTPTLSKALLVTGFAYDVRESQENNLNEFTRFIFHAQGVRRMGSAALDMCYVACGRFDGFWELKLHPWDTAAGVVIVQEAGGRVTDYQDQPFSIYEKKIVVSNGLIHKEMLEVLQQK